MTKKHDNSSEKKLDDATLRLFAQHQQATEVSGERKARMRKKLLEQIQPKSPIEFITIRAEEGEWQEIAPKLFKKQLHLHPATGLESYLLRAEPGAVAPAHDHGHDELCFVLEGEIDFEHISLKVGDYHFAPKGTLHGEAKSQTGALVLMQEL